MEQLNDNKLSREELLLIKGAQWIQIGDSWYWIETKNRIIEPIVPSIIIDNRLM